MAFNILSIGVFLLGFLVGGESALADVTLSIFNGKATSDATYVTYQYQYTGTVNYFRVYIDSDRNAATGYNIGSLGAEYLMENGNLYRYTGTGSNWSWNSLGPITSYSTASGIAKFTVLRSAIGETAPVGGSADLVYNVQDASQALYLPKFTETSMANAQATGDAANVTYQFQYTGSVKYFRIYIDTDHNPATGYSYGGVGADYLIENGNLYRYTGTGSNWSWNSLGPITSYSTASGIAKFTVLRSAIGETAPVGGSADLVYNVQDASQALYLPKFTQTSMANAQASNDATYVTYQYQYTGAVKYFRVYIDTDRNAATGYKFAGIGAEYLIENGQIYQYAGNGSSWSWNSLGSIFSYSTASGIAKFTVLRTTIGETAPTGESADLVYNAQDSYQSLLLPKFTEQYVDNVLTPQLDRFELVANDGLQPGTYPTTPGSYPYASNAWGGHMSRVARTNDGTIYLLRLRMSSTMTPAWTLIKRDPMTGDWSDVVSGTTSDDAYLLRNQVSDTIYVIAYPNGLPAIWSGPLFIQQAIPGAWPALSLSARHYGNAGIGADGTVCLKMSHEFSVAPTTSVTNTEYSCATSSSSGALTWGSYIAHPIGLRHCYDFLFPSVAGLGFYGLSQSDLYKDAAGFPNLAGFPYVFNGIRGYSTGISSDASWQQAEVHLPLPVPSPSTATVAPYERQVEAFVDSKNRAFSIVSKNTTDGTTPTVNQGMFLAVADPVTRAIIYSGKLSTPNYGSSRIIEDDKARLWLLWTNAGIHMTEVAVYKIVETVANGVTTFDVGTSYSLSNAFSKFGPGWSYTPYEITGNVYVASPRGGTPRTNTIDGYMNACTTQFTIADPSLRPNFDTSRCFNADNLGQMPVIYFRIRLPD